MLIRGALDGSVSRSRIEAEWPDRRDVSFRVAREALLGWFYSKDQRLLDPELDAGMRGDIADLALRFDRCDRLPIALLLPWYVTAVRDHGLGFVFVVGALIVLSIIFLAMWPYLGF